MRRQKVWEEYPLSDDNNSAWKLEISRGEQAFYSQPLGVALLASQKYTGKEEVIPLEVSSPGIMVDVDTIDEFHLGVTKKARSIIEKMVDSESLQFFKTEIEGGPYDQDFYIVNVINFIDAIDWEHSNYELENNYRQEAHTIQNQNTADVVQMNCLFLRRSVIPEHGIFWLARLEGCLCFTDSIKKALEECCSHSIGYKEIELKE